MSFATELSAARAAANLSQRAAVAALRVMGISISDRSLAGYEMGEREPDRVKQATVLKALAALQQRTETVEVKTTESVQPATESNATLIDLGAQSIWVPYYPARLAAGRTGSDPYDIEPEGGFPIPSAFARRVGLQGNMFSADVAGDSMRDELDDGDVVFGIRQSEWDREAVYALYLDGGLLIKRVVREGKTYTLVSNNPKYPPRPVATEDAYIIGRVVCSLNRM